MNTFKRKALMCAVLGGLGLAAGCAQLSPSPAQYKAMEGTSSSQCVQSLVYGTVHTATFGGKSTGTGGGGGKATCGASVVEFNNDGKAGQVPTK